MRDLAPMEHALALAREAANAGEAPVGAVIVENGRVLAAERNRMRELNDPTAHAEMLAIRTALAARGAGRLDGCDLYVTLEPCAMCAMALMHARFKRVVFGAHDPKTGAAGSVVDLFANRQLNHHTQIEGGVMGEACGKVLRDFFAERRELYRQRRAAPQDETGFEEESAPDSELLSIPAGEAFEVDPSEPHSKP